MLRLTINPELHAPRLLPERACVTAGFSPAPCRVFLWCMQPNAPHTQAPRWRCFPMQGINALVRNPIRTRPRYGPHIGQFGTGCRIKVNRKQVATPANQPLTQPKPMGFSASGIHRLTRPQPPVAE